MTHEDFYWATFIWKNALQSSFRTLTWGFDVNSITTVNDGTEFNVCGRMMHGKVKIQHTGMTNTFTITIIPDEGKQIVVENVMLENIVSTIDASIRHYHECRISVPDINANVA